MNDDWDPDWDPYDLLIELVEENQNKTEAIQQLQRAANQQAFLINALTKQNARLNEAMASCIHEQAKQITRIHALEGQVRELFAMKSSEL